MGLCIRMNGTQLRSQQGGVSTAAMLKTCTRCRGLREGNKAGMGEGATQETDAAPMSAWNSAIAALDT
jgi:hypothetical protein